MNHINCIPINIPSNAHSDSNTGGGGKGDTGEAGVKTDSGLYHLQLKYLVLASFTEAYGRVSTLLGPSQGPA